METSQRRRQAQCDDRGADRNLEGERRQGQRDCGPHGALFPVTVQQGDQADEDQQPDRGGQTSMEKLNRRIPVEGKAEAAAAERPGIAAAARAAAHHQ